MLEWLLIMLDGERISDWRDEYHYLANILSGLKAELNYIDIYLSRNKFEPMKRKLEIIEKQRLEAEIARVKLAMKDLEKINETAVDNDEWS